MNDPRSFLPKRYLSYFKNEEKRSVIVAKPQRPNHPKKISLFAVAFFALSLVGVAVSMFLISQNQDNRQQAAGYECDPGTPYCDDSGFCSEGYTAVGEGCVLTSNLKKSENRSQLSQSNSEVQVTNSCDSGWYICNVGCCGVKGTLNEGKRYSAISDNIYCSEGDSECLDGHFTWFYNEDLSNKPEIQAAVAIELIARGLKVDDETKTVEEIAVEPELKVEEEVVINAIGEEECNGQGKWFNGTCYLYWEVLPGGTHVVAPPGTINDYNYATFQSISLAEEYLMENLVVTDVADTEEAVDETEAEAEELEDTQETAVQNLIVSTANGVIYNQLDDRWKNIYIGEIIDENNKVVDVKFGNVGCGVVSVANLTGVSPEEVLSLYNINSYDGITTGGTSLEVNAEALEKLGYTTSTGVNGNGVMEDEIKSAQLSNDYSEVLQEMVNYQEEGGWEIMLNGNFNNLGKGGHWVVVEDIDVENGTITVIDSNGGEVKEYAFEDINVSSDSDAVTPKRILLAKQT